MPSSSVGVSNMQGNLKVQVPASHAPTPGMSKATRSRKLRKMEGENMEEGEAERGEEDKAACDVGHLK